MPKKIRRKSKHPHYKLKPGERVMLELSKDVHNTMVDLGMCHYPVELTEDVFQGKRTDEYNEFKLLIGKLNKEQDTGVIYDALWNYGQSLSI